MALTTQQLTGLDIASQRMADGDTYEGFANDQKNVDCATNNFGYNYTPQTPVDLKIEQPQENIDASVGEKNILSDLTKDQQDTFTPDSNAMNQNMTEIEKIKQSYIEKLQVMNAKNLENAKSKQEETELGLEEAGNYDQEAKLRELYAEQNLQGRVEAFDQIAIEMEDIYNQYYEKEKTIRGGGFASIAAGKKANLADEFNAQVAGLNMKAAVLSDNYTRAKTIADNYYTAAIATNNNRIGVQQTLLNLRNSDVIKLESKEEDFINQNIADLEAVNTRIETEKEGILNLQLNNGDAWIRAGIDMANDDYESIVAKMSPALATQSIIDQLAEKYPDAGISQTDSIQVAEKKMKTNSSIYAQSNGGNAPIVNKPISNKKSAETFEEFIGSKEEELQMSIADPETYRKEYDAIVADINSQMGDVVVYGRTEGINFINGTISASPDATWDEIYLLGREKAPDVSIKDLEAVMREAGVTKSSTSATGGMTDEAFMEWITGDN